MKIFMGASNLTAYMTLSCSGLGDQWRYVRNHIDGWYTNNFQMKRGDIRLIAPLIGDKPIAYETDFISSATYEDELNMKSLLRWFPSVEWTTINRAADSTDSKFAERREILQYGNANRFLLVMVPPWRLNDEELRSQLQNKVKHAQGTATDGPMPLWMEDRGDMMLNSVRTIQWVRKLNPNFKTMVMMAPCEFTGSEFMGAVQHCMMYHKIQQALPDYWVFSFYGPDKFHNCPIFPETYDSGKAADTFTGAVYWALKRFTSS